MQNSNSLENMKRQFVVVNIHRKMAVTGYYGYSFDRLLIIWSGWNIFYCFTNKTEDNVCYSNGLTHKFLQLRHRERPHSTLLALAKLCCKVCSFLLSSMSGLALYEYYPRLYKNYLIKRMHLAFSTEQVLWCPLNRNIFKRRES